MSAAVLKSMIARIEPILLAYKKIDTRGAARLRNELYADVNAAAERGDLTEAEVETFYEKNRVVNVAESQASLAWWEMNSHRFGGATSAAAEEPPLGPGEAADGDVEPSGEDWEKDLQ